MTRLTFEWGHAVGAWAPDGKTIFVSSARDGFANIYELAADGSGTLERLTRCQCDQWPSGTSPGGRYLAYTEDDPITRRDIWILPLEGEPEPFPFLKSGFHESHAVFSPDGQWLAYQSDESGRHEVYVRPFPGPGVKAQISTGGGTAPRWAPGGREIFYRAGFAMMAVEVARGSSFQVGRPRVLFENRSYPVGGGLGPNYDVSPDGNRFLMVERPEESPVTELPVIVNWLEELERRVPPSAN